MNTPTTPSTPPAEPTGPGVVSTGWLAANSSFERKRESRLVGGLGASLILHAVMLSIILAVFALAPPETLDRAKEIINVVFLPDPGPGGGGGGSPAPAPPKPLEIAQHKAPDPPPVVMPPIEVPPPPPPTLNAPVITNNAKLIQATGTSSISLQAYGGGGRGEGVGSGRGAGVGPGVGGGTGDGVYRPGNGVSTPTLVRQVRPNYTTEAMRAKIQGKVLLDVVIRRDGTVGDAKVVKSLDSSSGGLDQEAIKAAQKWLFQPAVRQGQPVDCLVQIELEFRIF